MKPEQENIYFSFLTQMMLEMILLSIVQMGLHEYFQIKGFDFEAFDFGIFGTFFCFHDGQKTVLLKNMPILVQGALRKSMQFQILPAKKYSHSVSHNENKLI